MKLLIDDTGDELTPFMGAHFIFVEFEDQDSRQDEYDARAAHPEASPYSTQRSFEPFHCHSPPKLTASGVLK